jgi:hypothetical protein
MKLNEDWETVLKQAELIGFTVERTPGGAVIDPPTRSGWRFLVTYEERHNPELLAEFEGWVREALHEAE